MSLVVKINSTCVKNSSISVIDKKWSIEGFTLAKFGGPFALIGIYPEKKELISFVGKCKICHDEEVIVGVWTISGSKTNKNGSQIECLPDTMKK